MPDYKVQLDIYSGPLDLLLYLTRREEVDIFDIPIARITDQYIQYVDLLQALDPEAAAEFLVLAATLMEIKSRMLLPRLPAEDEEQEDFEDPRLELVRQLLEYKKYKDLSFELADKAEEHTKRFGRQPGTEPEEAPALDLQDAQIWDLFAAFNKLMSDVGHAPTTHEVVYDDTPVSLHAADIQDHLLREGRSLVFEAIFEGRSRSEMVGLFLALLELVRQRRIRIEQSESFGPIYLHLLDETPITQQSITAAGGETAEELDYEGPSVALVSDTGVEAVEEVDDEIIDQELAEIDASLKSMSTELDEQREKLVREIDRDMDVQAVIKPLSDETEEPPAPAGAADSEEAALDKTVCDETANTNVDNTTADGGAGQSN